MRFMCSLSKAVQLLIWLSVLSMLLGLFLGYQVGSAAASTSPSAAAAMVTGPAGPAQPTV
ncbi:MAG TPA: hypothetical protein VHX38_21530 [Pseudonocardiaceae bacterium]|jgi:hypothetical protein|nr:hypothetical protein [Pseudonocardiaceae bacterium]